MKNSKILILGAGLSGLATAYYLERNGFKSTILETRNRLGGRIHTIYKKDEAPVELGATWMGKKHTHLIHLLSNLKIESFIQELGKKAIYEPISTSPPQMVELPSNEDPSFRIANGSSSLINSLANHLTSSEIILNAKVISIKSKNGIIEVNTMSESFDADFVVSTLPPNLLINTIEFIPSLPKELIQIAKNTHTWMGESIKICLTFDFPFWRKNSSGTMFSNVGPISELYDHSNAEDSYYALKGFMNGSFYGATPNERQNFVLDQLSKYYGDEVKSFRNYHECVWRLKSPTFYPYDGYILPHQNNGNPIYMKDYMEGKFFIAGSETAPSFPGYMDGAVESASIVAQKIINLNSKMN